jgi:hypothetical protein
MDPLANSHLQKHIRREQATSAKYFLSAVPFGRLFTIQHCPKQRLPKSSNFIRAALLFTDSFAVEFLDEKPEATI